MKRQPRSKRAGARSRAVFPRRRVTSWSGRALGRSWPRPRAWASRSSTMTASIACCVMAPTPADVRRKSRDFSNQTPPRNVSFAVGKRWELVALAIAVLSPLWLSSESAHAAANVCLSRAPRTVAEFQQVTEAQSPGFGIGDLTTMIDLPDGRRLYIFGDTSYHAVNADGSRGPIVGWGNNSAWLQSGRCFTLLRSANGDNRSWIQPPEQ